MANRIMIIDDEDYILKAMARILKIFSKTDVELYTSPEQAIKRAQTSIFDIFISDYQMPTMNGVELLSQVKSLQPDSVRMIVSGNSDKSVLVEAINNAEIYRFIEKPWDNQQFIIDINEALTYRRSLLEKTILSNQMRQQLV